MDKPNGAVIELAQALQKCFDAATSKATEAAERAERAVERLEGKMDTRLGNMDDTLRMIWKQGRGDPNQRLPIDD